MSFLLDTHVLIWWWADSERQPETYVRALETAVEQGQTASVSDISLWEIAMLLERGRLRITGAVDDLLTEVESHPLVRVLPITGRVAAESTRFGPDFPRDPADRLIGATARCHGLPLMTVDEPIRESGAVPLF